MDSLTLLLDPKAMETRLQRSPVLEHVLILETPNPEKIKIIYSPKPEKIQIKQISGKGTSKMEDRQQQPCSLNSTQDEHYQQTTHGRAGTTV